MTDILNYKNKVCVVTGASSGMGLSTVKLLVLLGARVYAVSRRACEVPGVEMAISADLSIKADIDRVFSKIPAHIDSFFGVAGLSGAKNDYMTTFNTNYTANVYITETYLTKRMTAGGSILYVTSTAGVAWKENLEECKLVLGINDWDQIQAKMAEIVAPGTPPQLAYMFSKRLVNAYACQKALDFGPEKIRVNAVLPGSTDTGMRDEFAAMTGGLENMIKFAGLAGRLATSDELGGPIVFLNSGLASFISGEELIVDFCDNAMKKLGVKPEMCGSPALLTEEMLKQMAAMRGQ